MTFRKVDRVENGMYARLTHLGRPLFKGFGHLGHIGVGLITPRGGTQLEPDRYVYLGPVGPCWRDISNYNLGRDSDYQWEELIIETEYNLDQVLDEDEDLL